MYEETNKKMKISLSYNLVNNLKKKINLNLRKERNNFFSVIYNFVLFQYMILLTN